MKKIFLKTKTGYTIIETMIAISLFIVIVMAGMGALLNANLLQQKSRDMRSIIDNLSFVMDDISKSLRTGYDYQCFTTPPISGDTLQSCDGGNGYAIMFKPQDYATNSKKWAYKIETYDGVLAVQKSEDGGSSWFPLTSSDIDLSMESSFTVKGALVGDNDQKQPFVTIKLIGNINYKNVTTPFILQTSVSQRLIDIGE